MKDYLKAGISGVRGIVGESLTAQIATSFAQAFGIYLGRGVVLVGRDTRPSGAMIERAVIAGLESVGCQPLHVGILATPTILLLTARLRAAGAIAITASHNPAPWNALKFIQHGGLFLNARNAEELYDIYHQGDYACVPEPLLRTPETLDNPMETHIRTILDYVDTERIRSAKLTVAVDCCNGVGAVHSRPFLERLGCTVYSCLDSPSGRFEREPEPLPSNLGTLCNLVQDRRCDIGFAQDPDGDRLAIVNEKGQPIGEDLTVALCADQVLSHHKKGPLVVSLSTSKAVNDIGVKHGCAVFRTKIGEIHVCETILEKEGVAGGESNGGVIVPDVHPCRDSFLAMALILELLAYRSSKLSDIRAEIPVYAIAKEKVRIPGTQTSSILRTFRARYRSENPVMLDGVFVERGDHWFHVRASNTEPILRITVESTSQKIATRECTRLCHEVSEIAAACAAR